MLPLIPFPFVVSLYIPLIIVHRTFNSYSSARANLRGPEQTCISIAANSARPTQVRGRLYFYAFLRGSRTHPFIMSTKLMYSLFIIRFPTISRQLLFLCSADRIFCGQQIVMSSELYRARVYTPSIIMTSRNER